jgi:hypothetical protein
MYGLILVEGGPGPCASGNPFWLVGWAYGKNSRTGLPYPKRPVYTSGPRDESGWRPLTWKTEAGAQRVADSLTHPATGNQRAMRWEVRPL